MLVHTKAIVVSALKYAEADLIVRCFTQESGLKTYLLRGVLKSRKGKLKASLFQPLTQLELVASHKGKGSLEYLKEAKIHRVYDTLHTNVVKSSMVLFISEMLKNSIREEEQNEDLYEYLENSLDWLDTHTAISNFHLLFLLRLTKYLGFYPEDSDVDKQYFNMLDGVFQDLKTNVYCIDGIAQSVLKLLLGTGFDALDQLKLNQSNRTIFLNMLLEYYQLHTDGFTKPKSLSVLQEIFH